MGSNINKSVSPEGAIDLSFKAKGTRVQKSLYMSLYSVFLLLPVSCTVSSPIAFMSFDKVASRNEFQAGTAILWVLLSLGMWAGIIYAYNHRRTTLKRTMRIIPKASVSANSLFNLEDCKDFVVRSDNTLGYTNDIHYVAVMTNRREARLTDYMSEDQAKELAEYINKNR